MPSKNTPTIVLASMILVTGCSGARTQIVARSEGQIAMESVAREESVAYESGLNAANNHCEKLKKKLIVDGNHETTVGEKQTVKITIPFSCR